MAIGHAYPSRSSHESEIALRILGARLCVRATLHAPGPVIIPLECGVVRRATTSIVDVTVVIPAHSPVSSIVVVDSAELFGLPVLAVAELRAVVNRGMVAPATLPIEEAFGGGCVHTLSFGSDDTLFVPRYGSETVARYSSDGAPLAPIRQVDLGLSTHTVASATASLEGLELLLLGDCGGGLANRVVAVNVDIPELSVRWSTPVKHCLGLAPLAARGLVVASSYDSKCLHILRLSDGSEVNRVPIRGHPLYLASDAASGTVFLSVRGYEGYDSNGVVLALEWCDGTLVKTGVVSSQLAHAVAVVPPSYTSGVPYLVCARRESSSIFVYRVPDFALIHTHKLEHANIAGLTADASGTSIVVCDNTAKALLVLEWPLEGMTLGE